MFQPTALHTDFARRLQADRVATVRVERRRGASLVARIRTALRGHRGPVVEQPSAATA
ncbi:hypothetical protein QDR37_14915 [Amnibacterium sp. CER49]|uniref:hypothetical protein n=1 Tax=Amnibacterium sp. CER49 TaxID=3039161 RepID=UPI0024492383|nr:hypothetical protein [Amnibacterium sp. CER49]MDH2445242.1 hypothetical protein [Amnibacterium sp. CER49]